LLLAAREMAMTEFFHEHMMRERFRELEALDRKLEEWGWFRCYGKGLNTDRGWRFRVGEAFIRLGRWLQGGVTPMDVADDRGASVR